MLQYFEHRMRIFIFTGDNLNVLNVKGAYTNMIFQEVCYHYFKLEHPYLTYRIRSHHI